MRSGAARAAAVFAAAVFTAAAAAQGSGGGGGAAAYAPRFAEHCASCHGARGASAVALVPHLGGQPSFYAITQLYLFREGRRNDHPMAQAMAVLAKGMSDTDLRGYSDFIATLPPPAAPDAATRDAARFERGRTLAFKHHCTGCHGSDLAGGRQVPRVGGQREDYLLIALKGFRAGIRLGYTNAMGEALAGLGEADLADLAHFMAHAVAPAASAAAATPATATAASGARR
ncbi:MAG: c-type cytochrome [Betaproteobacteria bacterium]|nr:c-type cytochrome [Betaproteobacteria bacterium]MCC6249008.1 c-type cytochrome [Rubrivivax sp.]MCL4699195.1 c-type cytochrome [Burkholderiaceae bacterium]